MEVPEEENTTTSDEIAELIERYNRMFLAVDYRGYMVTYTDFIRYEQGQCKYALSVPFAVNLGRLYFINKRINLQGVRLSKADNYLLVRMGFDDLNLIRRSSESVKYIWYSSTLVPEVRDLRQTGTVDTVLKSEFYPKSGQFCNRCFLMNSLLYDDGALKACALCIAPRYSELISYGKTVGEGPVTAMFNGYKFSFRLFPVDENHDRWFNYPCPENTGIVSLSDDEYPAYTDCPEHLVPKILPPPTGMKIQLQKMDIVDLANISTARVAWCEMIADECFKKIPESVLAARKLGNVLVDCCLKQVVTKKPMWTVKSGVPCHMVYMSLDGNFIIIVLEAMHLSLQLEFSRVAILCLTLQKQPAMSYQCKTTLIPNIGVTADHIVQDHVPLQMLQCALCCNRTALLWSYNVSRTSRFYCDACFLLHHTSSMSANIYSRFSHPDGIVWDKSYNLY
ncbi:MAG: hypothetical protein JSS82_07815 [Bacteroidetes bacterium]|nr:hypothetical protein [Bacteroidota bacterium]